jgi:hypothetical protein
LIRARASTLPVRAAFMSTLLNFFLSTRNRKHPRSASGPGWNRGDAAV